MPLRRVAQLEPQQTRAALIEAGQLITAELSLTPPPPTHRRREPSHAELPASAVEQDPLPWLLRRLDASVHDATETGSAARHAFAQLS